MAKLGLCKATLPVQMPKRPPEVPWKMLQLEKVTDVFFDFDGTLSMGSGRALEYVVPLLQEVKGTWVTDDIDGSGKEGVVPWAVLDEKMAKHVPSASIDMSDLSVLGTLACRRSLNESLRVLCERGVRLHLLTMGTPQVQKALLEAGGYDLNLFDSWLGPMDMARNQGLCHLFDNGDADGVEALDHFEFTAEQDMEELIKVSGGGERGPVLSRIVTMEKRLSKAALVTKLAGDGGLLVDDSWINIHDCYAKGVMYMHIDPVGVENTCSAITEWML
eukprot:TRINITY_DN2022_c1_g1_i4.p1 TRINITY_DN2022_c1_g1~~TRINITY_DN2022_c1_g1_i4.p1  ORF type:complete len:275 (+),score=53.16 TRINITY_DN2022_c1_g1_i4:73-897(+)